MEVRPDSTALELHNLTVTYDKKPAVWNADFSLPEGIMAGVMGPNGSGKTSMMKAIMELVKPSSGYVKVFGAPYAKVRDRVAYVPQRSSVDWDFPASVFDTVLMGRYSRRNLLGRLSKKDKEIAWACLEKVQLEAFADRQISQLSGGQQQRVFIARALAQQATLYLLDEPFAGVDAATENAIISLLKQMKAEGKTVVVVHHDLQTAPEYFDWLVLMNTRLITAAPIEQAFIPDLLNETYGGKLNILSKVGDLLKKHQYPVREQRKKRK